MKLFDLRFGEIIIIYPEINNSFTYNQMVDSPDNYNSLEEFQSFIVKKL